MVCSFIFSPLLREGKPPPLLLLLLDHQQIHSAAHPVQRLNEILSRHTGQSLDTIAEDTERDNFKSADAAREYGLVDEVIERRAEESIQPA